MQISAILRTHLHALGEALEDNETLRDPDQDLVATVRAVLHTWHEAVPSFLGLALIITIDGHPITVSTLDPHRAPAVGSSARLPLPAEEPRARSVDIVLYAGTPGAFVDFSADAAHILQLPLDAIVIDADLTPVGSSDPAHTSTIHQAAGVLIDRGHAPASALPALQALATTAGVTLLAAAQHLLLEPPA